MPQILLMKTSEQGDVLREQGEVLRELLPKLRIWLKRYLGPCAIYDDVVQDSLVEIGQAMTTFRGESSIDTFAYRIAIRVASRALKKQVRRAEVLKLVPPSPELIDPHSRLAERELLRQLYEALDTLPPKQRSAFVLCEIEEFSPTEAALVVGCKATTMRSQLRRARKTLSRILEDEGETL